MKIACFLPEKKAVVFSLELMKTVDFLSVITEEKK
jgi:hypothetical protein